MTVFFIMACEPDSNDNIANLSAILDTSNNVTDLVDVPNDLNYEPFKYSENNNYFMCDGIGPDSNILLLHLLLLFSVQGSVFRRIDALLGEFRVGGGVHDSYTFQCGLVGYFTFPGIDTR